MKNITKTIAIALISSFIAACGPENTPEAKKAEIEKLKVQQEEIAAQIAKLEDELSAIGDSTSNDESRTKVVATTAVSMEPFIHAIDVQGRVDGDENITYSAKVPGTISKINIKVGQRVSAGQVLAEIDSKPLQLQLAAMQKQAELVNTLYEKRKQLWDQQVGSEIEYLQAKNQKESFDKNIESMKQQLDMYSIKSDYSGTVDEVNLKVGQNVAPGMPYVTVINPAKLKIKTDLSESYAGLISAGDLVNIHFPDLNKTMTANVTYASRTINQMTRTFEVEIKLPANEALQPNMIAKLSIIDYEKLSALVVPINTIQQIEGESIVFIALTKDGKTIAQKRVVTVGKQYEGKAEIISGLNVNDRLITVGFQDLNDGQEIKL
jgi:membrane fusion protein, multidrug efflux system